MSQVLRKWIADQAVNNDKIDPTDTYTITGLRVDETNAVGRIAMGLSSPLDAIHIRRTDTSAGIIMDLDDGGSGRSYQITSDQSGFLNVRDRDLDVDRLTLYSVPSVGRLGVNSYSPQDTIHARSTVLASALRLDTDDGFAGRSYRVVSDTDGAFKIIDVDAGNVNRFQIANTGTLTVSGDATFDSNFQINGTVTVINTEIVVADQLEINQTDDQAALIVSQDNAGATATVMRIENAGSGHALTVDSGNVGIGTLTPAAPLHVQGDIITANGYNIGDTTHRIGTLWMASTVDYQTNLNFYSGGNNVTFATGGNVGIGSTIPTQALDVVGNILGSANIQGATLTINTGPSQFTGNVGIGISPSYPLHVSGAIVGTTTVTGGTGIIASTGNITASTGNIIATLGDMTAVAGDIAAPLGTITASSLNITSGPTSLAGPFSVTTPATTDTYMEISRAGFPAFKVQTYYVASPTTSRIVEMGATDGGQTHITYGSGGPTRRAISILSAGATLGYVGIGTQTPAQRLQVQGNIQVEGDFLGKPTASASNIGSSTRRIGTIYMDSTVNTGSTGLTIAPSGSPMLYVTPSGVGIGTDFPVNLLDVRSSGAVAAQLQAGSGGNNAFFRVRANGIGGDASIVVDSGDAANASTVDFYFAGNPGGSIEYKGWNMNINNSIGYTSVNIGSQPVLKVDSPGVDVSTSGNLTMNLRGGPTNSINLDFGNTFLAYAGIHQPHFLDTTVYNNIGKIILTPSTNMLYATSTGVGIFQADVPSAFLHVKSTVGAADAKIESTVGNAQLDLTPQFNANAILNMTAFSGIQQTGATDMTMFNNIGRIVLTPSSNMLYATSTGVGIFQADVPTAFLHVKSTVGLADAKIESTVGNAKLTFTPQFSSNAIIEFGAFAGIQQTGFTDTTVFNNAGQIVLSPSLGVLRASSAGVGLTYGDTFTPGYLLHMYRSSGSTEAKIESDDNNARLRLDCGNNQESEIFFQEQGNNEASIQYNATNQRLYIRGSDGLRFGTYPSTNTMNLYSSGLIHYSAYEAHPYTGGGDGYHFDLCVDSAGDMTTNRVQNIEVYGTLGSGTSGLIDLSGRSSQINNNTFIAFDLSVKHLGFGDVWYPPGYDSSGTIKHYDARFQIPSGPAVILINRGADMDGANPYRLLVWFRTVSH